MADDDLDTSIGGAADKAWFAAQRERMAVSSSSDAPNQTAGDPVRSTVDNDLSLLASIIQEELELARSGDGYEEQAVAEEIVRDHVAPVLAERDEVKAVLCAEVAQQKSNWDAARDANMTALETIGTLKDERQLLLWLHAEAVWQRDAAWEELDEHNEAAVEHYAENARLRAATERDARIIDRYRGELQSLKANATLPCQEPRPDTEATEQGDPLVPIGPVLAAKLLGAVTPATPTEPRDTEGLEYLRSYYKVPARIGVRVLFEDKPGVITGSSGPHLLVHMDGAAEPVPAHPTWEMQYLTAEVVGDKAPGGES